MRVYVFVRLRVDVDILIADISADIDVDVGRDIHKDIKVDVDIDIDAEIHICWLQEPPPPVRSPCEAGHEDADIVQICCYFKAFCKVP